MEMDFRGTKSYTALEPDSAWGVVDLWTPPTLQCVCQQACYVTQSQTLCQVIKLTRRIQMKASRQTLSRSEDEEADGFLGKSSVEVGVLREALEPLNTKLCVFGWREVCVCSVGGCV